MNIKVLKFMSVKDLDCSSDDVSTVANFNSELLLVGNLPSAKTLPSFRFLIIGANIERAHERFPCGGRRSGH